MGGGRTASSVVGGWTGPYVEVFFRPVGDEPFVLFLKYRPPTGLGSTTVLTAALLCPLLPYILLHCRTAALLLFCFCSTYIQRMIPLLPYVLLHRRTALLLFCYFSTYIERMIQHQLICFCPPYRPATGILREYHKYC